MSRHHLELHKIDMAWELPDMPTVSCTELVAKGGKEKEEDHIKEKKINKEDKEEKKEKMRKKR